MIKPSRSRILSILVSATVVLAVTPPSIATAAPSGGRAAQTWSMPRMDTHKKMPAADAAAIDAAAARFLRTVPDKSPGLWLAVWDPKKGYYEHAYGQAVVDGAAATVKDHFLIGSITKTVFATAVLEQVAAGTIKLSDTVRALDPSLADRFPTIAAATVGQLLGMTSMIPDYADAAVGIMLADHTHSFTRDELIALGLEQGTPVPAPGGYSTTGYIILGEVMKEVTGKSPEQLVNAVFNQARMTQSKLMTGSVVPPAPAAHGYVGAVIGADPQGIAAGVSTTTDVTNWQMDWGREGGGAYSTIGNLARWGSTCLGNTLLPKRLVATRLRTHQLTVGGNYGLGIIRQGDWLAHSGQAIGYEANVACNPKTGAVVAYAVNSTYGSALLDAEIGGAAFPEYLAAQG